MKKHFIKASAVVISAAMLAGVVPVTSLAAVDFGWEEVDGKFYWYENGVKQGTTGRGKEIYDSGTDAWYWLDAPDGVKAVSKDVYQESDAGQWAENEDGTGKWVRYDAEGHMIKGWSTTDAGTYYFDPTYGTMAKGWVNIDGNEHHFNSVTGVLEGSYGAIPEGYAWKEIDGKWYWYENGVRQGVSEDASYRGKEIYDPGTDAWYWLDNVQQGARAVNKDVYQDSNGGKWVRYNSEGRMVKGWDYTDHGTYYFDLTTGAMAKGIVRINGLDYVFDETTGVYQGEYKGGTVSYVWAKTREVNYNTNGSLSGYTRYIYDDLGNVISETTYNNTRNSINQTRYTYDEESRVTLCSYRDFTNERNDYTIESTYDATTGLLTKEVQKDYEGDVKQVHNYTYKNGKIDKETLTDESGKSLNGYLEYSYDSKGNATRITYYDASGSRVQYAQNTYYEYGGQTYLKMSLICDDDNKVLSGSEYVRQGAELVKETIYTRNREISTYTIYDLTTIPDVESHETYTSTSTTYNGGDKAIRTTTYEYTRIEIIS